MKNIHPSHYSCFLEKYFNTHKGINNRQLLAFLNSDSKFIILRNENINNSGGVVEASYKKVYKDNSAIGELFFYSGYTPYDTVAGGFVYGFVYVDNTEVLFYRLGLMMSESDMNVFSSLPEIFIKKNGTWHWKNGNQSVTDLHNLMLSRDRRLPKVFIELQDTWDNIISNLEIDGVKVEVR